jgi:hypothetical protein
MALFDFLIDLLGAPVGDVETTIFYAIASVILIAVFRAVLDLITLTAKTLRGV